MYNDERLSISSAHREFHERGLASGLQALQVKTEGRTSVPVAKIDWAIRRIALTELGHLAEGRVVLPFSVVPEILRKPHGANWRLVIAPSATMRVEGALRAAETVLQSRWNMIDMFQGSRALIV